MFTKRHEQELAEIKALTLELGQRCHEILQELETLKEAQARLAARDRGASAERGRDVGRRAERVNGGKPPAKAKAAKKPRARQAPPEPVRAKQAKRRGDVAPKRRRRDLAPSPDSDES